ncbi:MAG: hypothetical protein U0235_14160 [Polyangiaceae bacterium]
METLWHVVGETLQIAAGAGYMREHLAERMLRDSRIHLIFEDERDPPAVHRASSGVAGPGEAMADVKRAMKEPMRGLGTLGDFALRKAKDAGLGRERLPVHPRSRARPHWSTATSVSLRERALRKHGRNIGEMHSSAASPTWPWTLCASARSCRARHARSSGAASRARRKLNLATIYAGIAERRLEANLAAFDRNDDELRKSVASCAYDDGGYALDVRDSSRPIHEISLDPFAHCRAPE